MNFAQSIFALFLSACTLPAFAVTNEAADLHPDTEPRIGELRLEKLPIRLSSVSGARAIGAAGGSVLVLDPSAHSIRRVDLHGDYAPDSWRLNTEVETALAETPSTSVLDLGADGFVVVGSLVKPFRDRCLVLRPGASTCELQPKPEKPAAMSEHASWIVRARSFGEGVLWSSGATVFVTDRGLPWSAMKPTYESKADRIVDFDLDQNGVLVTLELAYVNGAAEFSLVAHRNEFAHDWAGVVPGRHDDRAGCFLFGSVAVVYSGQSIRARRAGATDWTKVGTIPNVLKSAWRFDTNTVLFVSKSGDGETLWALRVS